MSNGSCVLMTLKVAEWLVENSLIIKGILTSCFAIVVVSQEEVASEGDAANIQHPQLHLPPQRLLHLDNNVLNKISDL